MNIHVFSSEQDQRGAEGSAPPSCSGAWGHSPCRVSYCLIWTSSTQSAGNQPVRPFTVPSQKPPSPMLSTGGTEARQLSGNHRTPGDRPTHHRRLRVCPPPLSFTPSHPFPSFIFLAFSLGRFWDPHSRQKRTDGHSTGEACGGQRDTQMDTLEGGHQAEAGATSLLLSSRSTPLLPPLEPTPSLLCCPPQGSLPKAQGHCAVPKRLGHTMAQRRVDLTAVSFSGSHGRRAPMRTGPQK